MRAVIDWLEAPPHQKSCRTRPSSASANREGRHDILGSAKRVPVNFGDAYLDIMAVADVFISRASPQRYARLLDNRVPHGRNSHSFVMAIRLVAVQLRNITRSSRSLY